MKIQPARAETFIARPDEAVRAVLLFGPDAGMVRQRAERLGRGIVSDLADAFRVAELTASLLADDPARLSDEAAALAFGGGRRLVRVRPAEDRNARIFADFLATPSGDALVVAEAGDLGTRSPLRKAFEEAPAGAAIGCYPERGAALLRTATTRAAEQGLVLEEEAATRLAELVGEDRMLMMMEVDKLVLYRGSGTIGAEDVRAVSAGSGGVSADDLAFAALDGDRRQAAHLLARLRADSASPIGALRAVQRHVQRLHDAAQRVARGEAPDAAVTSLRPPVFFAVRTRFRTQLETWSAIRLETVLEALLEAEVATKRTGAPAELILERVVLGIASTAAARAAKGSGPGRRSR